jgi:hypothetical protein
MLLFGNGFYLKGQYDLDFWPLNPKLQMGHVLVKTNALTKFEDQQPMDCQVIDQKQFYLQGHCDLDLWPLDPKIKRDHPLAKIIAPVQFKDQGPMGWNVIVRKLLLTTKKNWP